MSDHLFEDRDLGELFAHVPDYADAEAFEGRVTRGLHMKLWLRQGLIVLAGFVGGLYALAQFIHLPNWSVEGKTVYGSTLVKAAADTDQTLRVGARFVDAAKGGAVNLLDSSAHYLTFMQTPVFFWLSFSLCLAFLGLYYAYSQEETI